MAQVFFRSLDNVDFYCMLGHVGYEDSSLTFQFHCLLQLYIQEVHVAFV